MPPETSAAAYRSYVLLAQLLSVEWATKRNESHRIGRQTTTAIYPPVNDLHFLCMPLLVGGSWGRARSLLIFSLFTVTRLALAALAALAAVVAFFICHLVVWTINSQHNCRFSGDPCFYPCRCCCCCCWLIEAPSSHMPLAVGKCF